jgi:glucan phosphoethanolaminetransferase (alkaline phosphatase superfamily)
MSLNEGLGFFYIAGLFWIFAIIIIYSLSTFWNIKFLLKSKWEEYSWIKLYAAIASFLMVGVYIYVILNLIIAKTFNHDFFGVMILRPVLFLIGGVLASSARARLTSLKQGGKEGWMLKHKI